MYRIILTNSDNVNANDCHEEGSFLACDKDSRSLESGTPNRWLSSNITYGYSSRSKHGYRAMTFQYLCLVLIVSLLFITGCDSTPSQETTMLFQAAQEGNVKRIKELVSKGADVNANDGRGYTPLHYTSDVSKEKLKSMRGLNTETVEESVAVAFTVSKFDGYEKSTLFLIEKGANVNAENNDGNTPLELAERVENVGVIEILKLHGGQ